MNVAKKSTTKLPQSWQQGINVQLEEAKDEEADSGVGSADSVDFQDALLNLKALNGASGSVPECESNQSKVNELQCKQTDHPTACETFKGDLESLSPIKDSKGEKDILEQIDDIVNDTVPGEKVVANGVAAGKPVTSKLDAETEEDDVLILNPDDNYETKKDGKLLELSILKGKTLPGNGAQMRNPLKIGDKVRSKVHTIMSKFVQNNPVVNSLLAKAKSVDSEESDGSGAGTGVASPLPVRPGKGNLFDNFDITLTDRENKSPQVTSDTISGNKCISPPLMASNDIETSPVERLHDETNKKPAAETSCSEPAATVLQPDIGSLSQTLKESANSVGETERTESDKCAVDPEGTKDVLLDSRTDLMDTKTTQDKTECTITDSTVQKETECKNKAYKGSECESDAAPPLKPVSGSCAGQEDQTINNTITNTECQKAECRKEVDSAPDETMDTSENATSSSVGECDELTKESAEGKEDTPLCHQVTDRKRQHSQDPLVLDNDDTKDTVPQVPKRSRLDGLIGKLGERVAFTSDAPDNDAFEDDDSTPGDIDSVEKQSQEPISGSASEDEEEKTSSSDSGAKITLTRKDLEQLIIMSATAAIQQHQSQEILQLNRRVEELTQASDEWRTKAKELQNQMLELTVLQQKLDKRKAHTAALKSITTRSIGVGVTEDRLRTTTPQKATGNKTPPATPPANGQTPLSWPVATNPPTLRLPALTPAVTQSMAALNTSVAHLLSQTAHMPTVASCQAAAAKAAVGKPVDTSGQVPGAISLNHTGSTRVPSVAAVSSNNMVLVNSTTGLPMVKTKTSNTILKAASRDLIDLTMEDDAGGTKQAGKQPVLAQARVVASQQMVRQIPPLCQSMPMVATSSAILFSTPGGTQIVNAGIGPRPNMLQVVTLPNGSTLKPGQYVTVVPGQSGAVLRPSTTLTTLSTAPRFVTQPGMLRLIPPQLLPSGNSNVRVAVPTAVSVAACLASAPTVQGVATAATPQLRTALHPAPLPMGICPRNLPVNVKPAAPKPGLKISRVKQGIVLSWNMTLPTDCVEISTYQLYAYQETGTTPMTSLWKKVGDVNALALPMACTLTQFQDGNKYHFAVRAVDVYGRSGPFSDPSFIHLTKIT